MTSDELDHAVDELLRFEGAVPTSARTLTADVDLRGCPMKKGDRVLFNWLGANRDPDTFTDPGVIDFQRPNAARHVAFGAGPHHCLGSHLARREIRLSLEAIAGLERFDLVPGTDVRFKPAFARGPKALPLIFAR
jgi:cytochrome P450